MDKKGQAALEVLIIMGVLIIGAIIFATIYFGSFGKNVNRDIGLSSTIDNFINDVDYDVPSDNNYTPPTPPSLCGNGICDAGEATTCPQDCTTGTNISGLTFVLDPESPSLINTDFNIIVNLTSDYPSVNVTSILITKYDEVDYTFYPTNNCELNGDYSSEFTTAGQLLPSGMPNKLSNSFEFSCTTTGNYDFEFSVSTPDGSQSLTGDLVNSGFYPNGKIINIATACNDPLGTVSFDPLGGTYTTPINISLSYTDPNCSDYNIHYTIDGSEPTLSSSIYSSEILVYTTTTVKAKVFSKNSAGADVSGSVASEYYVINNELCFSGVGEGTGTEADPKVICTPKELNDVRDHLDWYYVLGQDIDLNHTILSNDPTATWYDDVNGWIPIGANLGNNQFGGSFDGAGFTLTNLYMNRPTRDDLGLFGYFDLRVRPNGGVAIPKVLNLKLENVNIIGGSNVGALVGLVSAGSISNSYSTGSVSGTNVVGGLVGQMGYGQTFSINDSYSTCSIIGNNFVGGLFGTGAGIITSSYATGFVFGNDNVGGLIGNDGGSLISKSYATGSVSGHSGVGGLVGRQHSSSISKSYATGSVSGTGVDIGGLVGEINGASIISNSYSTGNSVSSWSQYSHGGFIGDLSSSFTVELQNNYSTGKVIFTGVSVNPTDRGFLGDNVFFGVIGSDNFWDKESSEQLTSQGPNDKIIGKTTAQMVDQNTYTDWNFTDVWQIQAGCYPTLRENPQSLLTCPEIQVATPVASPANTDIYTDKLITLSTDTPDANIYYTTDSSDPTESSTLYTVPISITASTTLKAKAFKTGFIPSDILAINYIMHIVTPIAIPGCPEYASPVSVALSTTTTGATIRYTLNGTEPTTTSFLYSAPILISTTTTIKAKAYKNGLASGMLTANYTIDPSWTNICPGITGPVSYNGYDYNTVLIGNQCWLKENLRTTKYNDNADISSDEWSITSNPNYGKLYSFSAVSTGKLCPVGWHVPTHDEFTTLERAVCNTATCVTDFPYDTTTHGGVRGTSEGSNLKSRPSDSVPWNGNNCSGFSGLPNGYNGGRKLNSVGYFWSQSLYNSFVWARTLGILDPFVFREYYAPEYQFSVRCLRD